MKATKVKESAPAESQAAATLGAAIRAARSDAGVKYRELEGRCWATEQAIIDWEQGRAVPNSAQWGALRGMFPPLTSLHKLWEEARYATDRSDRAAVVAGSQPDPSSEEALREASELLRDAVPNLRSFSLQIDDDGAILVQYEIRRVVVTMTTGALTLPAAPAKGG